MNQPPCPHLKRERESERGEEEERREFEWRRGELSMGNSLRCCIACVLPCGALDVIRIVHLNGHVDEFSRPVPAREILAAHPGHVLSNPCSAPGGGIAGRIMIVSPESELKRGSFYFLIPAVSVPDKKKRNKSQKPKDSKDSSSNKPMVQDKYSQDILSERKSGHRRKRSGRVGVWRPHLESIMEDL